MAINFTRKAHIPYKMAVAIFWGDLESVEWLTPNKVKIAMGPFARKFAIDYNRCRRYLRTLEEWGMVSDVDTDHGVAIFTAIFPPRRGVDL